MFLRLAVGLLLACACVMPTWAQDLEKPPVFIIEPGAPPGFENLDLPQQTLIDVDYGGQSISPAGAIYTSTDIRFKNPEAIVRELPGVIFPERVQRALTGPLEPNADRICERPGMPAGCGVLEPEVAGVIFDAARFKVEIFVGRSMLSLSRINEEERIPPPSDDWSGLATLGGSLSGARDTETSYNFRGDTLIARGSTHLNFVSDLQTGANYVVDRLSLNHDHRDWQLTGGLYRSSPFRVLGENEVVGLRMRSSLRTRTRLYLDRAYGSRLQIFLMRRSLVQVFREGRLLVSGVYDVGNQQLDTSELPSGAYEVEIRIRDPISGERRESQFFAKTNDLPPLGQIHFSGEAGMIRERTNRENPLQVSRAGLVRFSSAMRISTHYGLDLDVAYIDEETVLTVGALWLGQNVVVRAGPIVTSRGSAGVEFFGAYESGPFFANLNLRGFWGDSSSRFIRIPTTDLLFTMGYTWKRVRFGLRGNLRDRSIDGDPRYSVTPSIRIGLFRRAKFRGDLSLEYTRADQGNIFLVKINLVEWFKDLVLSQSVAGRYEDSNGEGQGIAEADLRAQWRSPASIPADLQADLRVSRRRDRTSISANGDLRSHRGAVNAFVEESFNDDSGPETFYGTQFSVGIIGDREGIAALGENAGASALLIEIGGDYEGALFDVFVNDSRRAKARVGQPLLLPLPPYGQYNVRISSTKGQSVDYDSKSHSVTLHPGSTARLRWDVRRIFVLIAAIVRPDGSPVAQARIEGAVGEAGTDESGFLQADVVPGAKLTLKTRDPNLICDVIVPENPDVEDFMVLDELACSGERAPGKVSTQTVLEAKPVSTP